MTFISKTKLSIMIITSSTPNTLQLLVKGKITPITTILDNVAHKHAILHQTWLYKCLKAVITIIILISLLKLRNRQIDL